MPVRLWSPDDDTESTLLGAEETKSVPAKNAKARAPGIGFKLSIATGVLSLVLNLTIFLSIRDDRVQTFQALSRLRRPNSFIGLENLPLEKQIVAPRTIHPQLLSIINKSEPFVSYGDDPVSFSSWPGFWPPEERAFHVSSEISTIAEFMTVDYKLENCSLQLRMPSSRIVSSDIVLGHSRNRIDIWLLDVPYHLDAKHLSWKRRPQRRAKIDTIDVDFDLSYNYSFHCPLNSLWAFEFSAAEETTNIRWGQNFSGPDPRVEVLQKSSVLLV